MNIENSAAIQIFVNSHTENHHSSLFFQISIHHFVFFEFFVFIVLQNIYLKNYFIRNVTILFKRDSLRS